MIPHMRIVSLLASATEIVCALGAGEMLVGRSHECDNPPWVSKLPACTRPAFDTTLSSREIDEEVRRRIHNGLPLYHVDAELIRELKPDFLITQAHCDVCAVTPADVERAECPAAVQVLALSAGSLEGIFQGIRDIARALQRAHEGELLIGAMCSRINDVRTAVKNFPTPSVVVLEWIDPIFAMANWGPELVEAANGRLILGEKAKHSVAIPWESVVAADPEFLIIAPCGFDLDRTRNEMVTLGMHPGWHELRAVRDGLVAIADGNKYFNRSGTTIVETVEILAEILHPRLKKTSWLGRAWQRCKCTSDALTG